MGKPRRSGRRNRRRTQKSPRPPRAVTANAMGLNDWTGVSRLVRPLDRQGLCALLAAAADSPGGGHRLPSLVVLWATGIRAASGSGTIDGRGLRLLLAGVRRVVPALRRLEDCWPADPRFVVGWPFEGRMLRIHPGEYSDPLMLLRTATVTARAIDDAVLATHGFSLSDLIEAALSYGDWRLSSIARCWPTAGLHRDDPEQGDGDLASQLKRISATPVAVTDDEVDVALSVQHADPAVWTASCSNPDRATAAWAWASVDADQLSLALGPRTATLGYALSLRHGGNEFPVPASMVLSGLAAAAGKLAAEVADDETARDLLQRVVTGQALSILTMSSPPSRRPVDAPAKTDSVPDFAGFVSLPSQRRALVVKVVTALDWDALEHELAAADAELLTLDVEGVRSLGVPLDPTGAVLPLVVYGGPCLEPLGERGPIAHLHVEDLLTMVRDLDQDKLDHDVLLQFLEELILLPGIEHFLPFDAEDVRRHWRHFGVLNPTGETDVALAVDPRPDDTAWARAAAWAPIEAVLCAACLPPSWFWASARLDERGYATLFGKDKSVVFVRTDPAAVVRTSLDNALPNLQIDATFGYGVADGVFLTLVNRPETAQLLTEPFDSPVLVNIDFTAERRPDGGDEQVAVGWRAAREPLPIIDLLFGPDWFELLADSPSDAHQLVGEVLLRGLTDLTADLGVERCDRARRAFLEAWCSAPPVAMLHFQETTRDYRPERAFVLPRSFASRARAERAVAQAVTRAGIGSCALVDGEARRFVRDRLAPLIEETLSSTLSSWSPEALLLVAEQVNDAYGERARAVAEIERALAAPWAASWQELSRSAPEESEMTRPLDLLLERLLITPLAGPVVPDRFDIAEAADLVAYALETELALDSTRRQLHGLAVMIAPDGRVAVLPGPASKLRAERHLTEDSPDLDLPGYLRADRDDRLRIHQGQETEPPLRPARIDGRPSRQTNDFRPLAGVADVPPSLLAADALLRRECGTGMDGLNAVLGTAVSWHRDDDHVVLVERSDLRREVIAWSHLSTEEIDAAIDRLTLDPGQLASEGISYAAQERRHHRIAISPIPVVGGRLLVMPWRIFAAQNTYANYLDDGRLPWHPEDFPKRVAQSFDHYRQIGNRALERAALEQANALGLRGSINVTPAIAKAAGLTIAGEIDLLLADPTRQRIWVCEVKDIYTAVSPQTIQRRIDKYTSSRHGFVRRLLMRQREVADDTSGALALLGLPGTFGSWRVLPLMITRRVEPAAFVAGIGVPFVVIADLTATLSAPADPSSGHVPIGST